MKELFAAAVLGYLGWRYLVPPSTQQQLIERAKAEANALLNSVEASAGNYVITGTPQLPATPAQPIATTPPPANQNTFAQWYNTIANPVPPTIGLPPLLAPPAIHIYASAGGKMYVK